MPASDVLPSPGGPANSRWSAGWLALEGRLDHDAQVLGQLALADELGEGPGTEPGLVGLLGRRGHRVDRSAGTAPGSTAGVGPVHGRQHLLRASGLTGCAPARAGRSAPAPRPARRRRAASRAPDLVGSRNRARPGRRGPRPGPSRRRTGRSPPPSRDGRSSRALSSSSRRAAVFLPTPGHRAQGVDVVLEDGGGQGGRATARTGWPGRATGPPRGPRAGPRSSAARRRGRSRRARWRPRGRGCARGGRPRSPGAPRPASDVVGTDAR